MLARVSSIESFRRWREDEEADLDALIRQITTDEPSEKMLAGTAFHKALELASTGTHDTLQANGYTFHVIDGCIDLPDIREMRAYGRYGSLSVTGQVDAITGKTVVDHKTTSRCDPERYLGGCQWKFYLDIFGADVFRWNIFEITKIGEHEYRVGAPHVLTAYRYPELKEDCARLAADYLAFASRHLDKFIPSVMAG